VSRAFPPAAPAARLSVYRFGPPQGSDGGVLGALERMESEGAPALDALFVAVDPATGALAALDLDVGRADGTLSALLDFRLDAASRRDLTQRTLGPHAGGVPRAVIEDLGRALGPGGALLVLLAEGAVPPEAGAAIARAGGHLVLEEDVRAARLADVAARLRPAL
jgi:hypothetical protein